MEVGPIVRDGKMTKALVIGMYGGTRYARSTEGTSLLEVQVLTKEGAFLLAELRVKGIMDIPGTVQKIPGRGHRFVLRCPLSVATPGKDLKWWNKKGEEGGADAARAQADMEKARVKQLDEDLLNEAL